MSVYIYEALLQQLASMMVVVVNGTLGSWFPTALL